MILITQCNLLDDCICNLIFYLDLDINNKTEYFNNDNINSLECDCHIQLLNS